MGPEVVEPHRVDWTPAAHFQGDQFRNEVCGLNFLNEVCILVCFPGMGFFVSRLIADREFKKAHSLIGIVPQDKVRAEVRVDNMGREGVCIVGELGDWQAGSLLQIGVV